ncbi:MAG: CRTAC1 family protein [bacterium]|nr:CRTAC1 family protein [bacterium]
MPLKRVASALLALVAGLALAIGLSAPARTAPERNSDAELQQAKSDVDALADIHDDRRRISEAQAFLKRYPGNYWRHLGYRLWLFSAWRLGDSAELQRGADAYLQEFPESGTAHGSVSRYFYEARVFKERGYESARLAKQYFERDLNIGEGLASMQRVSSETAAIPVQPQWRPPTGRDQFINYLGSRFNLARYELSRNQRKLALEMIAPVIELDPFGVDEEETLAPFYFVQGQAYESLGDAKQAYRAYLSAMGVGDAQNRYASQAQSKLQVVGEKAGKEGRDAALRTLVPAALAKVPLARFTDVTVPAGLKEAKGARAAWADVDDDNDADLLLDGSTLMINQGSGFTESSEEWGLKARRNAGLFADVDNDGDLDLYTLGSGSRENRLLRNEGKRFEDVTSSTATSSPDSEVTAAGWLDYDRDGWVDLYIAGMNEVTRIMAERSNEPAPDMLLRNIDGGLHHTPDAGAGIAAERSSPGEGGGVSAGDYDSDGNIDLFVANRDATPSYLWHNKGSSFSDVASILGLEEDSANRAASSSAADWGDVNNDGALDLFVCNWSTPAERLNYQNSAFYMQQSGGFSNVRRSEGIRGGTALTEPLFADFNNDGILDLYLTASGSSQRSFLYINDGKGGWHDMTYLSGSRVFGAQGSTAVDFDRDGDMDLLVCLGNSVRLLRNETSKQHWLQVHVEGGMKPGAAIEAKPWSNRAGIGTRVTLTVGGETFTREIQSGKGSGCGNELIAHFGLGGRKGRMSLTVRFPSGREVTRAIVNVDQRIEIREGDVAKEKPQRPEAPPAQQRGLGS